MSPYALLYYFWLAVVVVVGGIFTVYVGYGVFLVATWIAEFFVDRAMNPALKSLVDWMVWG